LIATITARMMQRFMVLTPLVLVGRHGAVAVDYDRLRRSGQVSGGIPTSGKSDCFKRQLIERHFAVMVAAGEAHKLAIEIERKIS